jgi:hypothetical protein
MTRHRFSLCIAALLCVVAHSVSAAPATQLFVSVYPYCDLSVSACPLLPALRPFIVGQPIPIWVSALDSNGHLATHYTSTVSVTTGVAPSTLPSPHTYTAANNSAFQFTLTVNQLPVGVAFPASIPVVATDTSRLSGDTQVPVNPAAQAIVQSAPALSSIFELALGAVLSVVASFSLYSTRRANFLLRVQHDRFRSQR